MRWNRLGIVLAAAIAAFTAGTQTATARGRVAIGVTETIASYDPYADSVSLAYSIWCQVLGCLGIYDYSKADYVGMLAESWEVDKANPNIWTFHLRHGLKRQNDGKELTAEDVVFSFHRVNTDPQSQQKQNVAPVKEIDGGRQIHRAGRHQAADRLAARIPVRPVHHHRQGPLRKVRCPRRRSQISLGLGTLQAQGAGDRPAHRAGKGPGQSRRPSPRTRIR